MSIFYFIAGIIFGIVAVVCLLAVDNNTKEYNKYVKPYKELLSDHISKFKFSTRVANLVYFTHNKYTVVLNLEKKEVYLYEDTKIISTTFEVNQKECEHLYTVLETAYHTDIYVNVIVSNGVVVTKPKSEVDEIVEKNEAHPSVDDILDKISKEGMSSLSDIELEILKNNSED
jgi:hypothetical protein